jgi:hypothetical protein
LHDIVVLRPTNTNEIRTILEIGAIPATRRLIVLTRPLVFPSHPAALFGLTAKHKETYMGGPIIEKVRVSQLVSEEPCRTTKLDTDVLTLTVLPCVDGRPLLAQIERDRTCFRVVLRTVSTILDPVHSE